MSDNSTDASGNTEQFRAFVHAPDQVEQSTSRTPMIIGGVVVVVVLLGIVALLLV